MFNLAKSALIRRYVPAQGASILLRRSERDDRDREDVFLDRGYVFFLTFFTNLDMLNDSGKWILSNDRHHVCDKLDVLRPWFDLLWLIYQE